MAVTAVSSCHEEHAKRRRLLIAYGCRVTGWYDLLDRTPVQSQRPSRRLQVELQVAVGRLAFAAVKPHAPDARVLARVIAPDTSNDQRLRVKILGALVVPHKTNDPKADPKLIAERRRLSQILHGIEPIVHSVPVRASLAPGYGCGRGPDCGRGCGRGRGPGCGAWLWP